MKYSLNGREVAVERIDGYDVDAYIQKAYYVDTEQDLTENELEALQEANQETFQEDLLNKSIVVAEYAFEGDR